MTFDYFLKSLKTLVDLAESEIAENIVFNANFTMVRNGNCLKSETCGAASG